MTSPTDTPTPKAFLIDLAERAGAQYVEALIGFVLLAEVLDVSVLGAAAVAALPALFSVLRVGVFELIPVLKPRTFIGDLLLRTGAAYVGSFLALVAVNPGDVATYRLAFAAAAPAALAVLKAGIADRRTPGSASLVAGQLAA